MRRAILLFLVLFPLGSPAASPKCARFVASMGILSQLSRYTWPSQSLSNQRVTDSARAENIMQEIYYGMDPISQELTAFLSGISDDEVQSLRNNISDLFNIANADYQIQLDTTDIALVGARRIGEFGCGSGMVCAYLSFENPDKQVVAIDQLPRLETLVQHRLSIVGASLGAVEFRNSSFDDVVIPEGSLDGAVVNLTLYLLPYPAKDALFEKLRRSLRSQGRLVVQDPVFFGRHEMDETIQQTANEVVASGMPITEFQFALWAGMRSGHFLRRTGPDYRCELTPLFYDELGPFIEKRGFKVDEIEHFRRSGYTRVVATKP